MSEVEVKPGESINDALKRVPIIKALYKDGSSKEPAHNRRPEVPVWMDGWATSQEIDPVSGRTVIKITFTYRPFDFFS